MLPQRHPKEGAWLLQDYPGDLVRVDCPKRGRAGSYSLPALVARHGPRAGLPEVLSLLAAGFPELARAVKGQSG